MGYISPSPFRFEGEGRVRLIHFVTFCLLLYFKFDCFAAFRYFPHFFIRAKSSAIHDRR